MIDLIVIIALVVAAFAGWSQGFVRQLLGLAILAGAIAAALLFRAPLAPIMRSMLGKESSDGVVQMVAAAAVFLVVLVVGNVAASLFYRRIPFLAHSNLADEALGAVFSVGLRLLELSVILVIVDAFYRRASTLPIAGVGIADMLAGALKDSVVAHLLRSTTVPLVLQVLGPFVPAEYRTLLDLPVR